jgi:hypothetical protein
VANPAAIYTVASQSITLLYYPKILEKSREKKIFFVFEDGMAQPLNSRRKMTRTFPKKKKKIEFGHCHNPIS